MNKPTVTKAQLRRAVETVEALGKTVTGVRINPDGSADVLLTEAPAAPVTSDPLDDELKRWSEAHGYG